jgi:hypothetical protein
MKGQIYKICTRLNDGQIAVTEATEQLLELFSLVEQSKECEHEYQVDSSSAIPFDLICKKCGKQH